MIKTCSSACFITPYSEFIIRAGRNGLKPDRKKVHFDKAGRNSYHQSMKTIVSEKGQITIPKPLRVRLGLHKGQVLEVREDKGKLVMTKLNSPHPFEKYYGILQVDKTTDEIITELRGEAFPRGHRHR